MSCGAEIILVHKADTREMECSPKGFPGTNHPVRFGNDDTVYRVPERGLPGPELPELLAGCFVWGLSTHTNEVEESKYK